MYDSEAIREKLGIKNFFKTLSYKIDFARDNPDYFWADGLTIFVGPQGSGKTLSAVNYACNLLKKYPKAKFVTNLMIKDYPIVEFDEYLKSEHGKIALENFDQLSEIKKKSLIKDYYTFNRVFRFSNADDLKRFNNCDEGVIYLIDEIQLYFNSLQSKNINPEVMTEISQQRKQRKHIICTSQVFGRMAKPLREQFSTIIFCKNYFKCLQHNKVVLKDDIEENTDDDMHVHGKVSEVVWFFHSPHMYNRYDTYYKIQTTEFVDNDEKKGDIYDSSIVLNNSTLERGKK